MKKKTRQPKKAKKKAYTPYYPESEQIKRIKALEQELAFTSEQRDMLIKRMRPMLDDAFLFYRQQLGDLLTEDQKEHADAAGVTHDQYAMQLIRLCNLKISELSSLRG